jgi:hypothetical protein
VRDHQAVYPVATQCRVLRVSPSGFYAWRERGPSARAQRDTTLLASIQHFHQRSDGTYGARRLWKDLRDRWSGASGPAWCRRVGRRKRRPRHATRSARSVQAAAGIQRRDRDKGVTR